MEQNNHPAQFLNDQEWSEALRNRFDALHTRIAVLTKENKALQAKCEQQQTALKEAKTWVVEALHNEKHPATVKCAQDDLKLIDEALSREGGKEVENA